jgi:hypothetical protein
MNRSAASTPRPKGNAAKPATKVQKTSTKKTDPPLKANQLKILQFLLSAVSFLGVLESSQDNVRNIRDMCGKCYHSYHVGQVKRFLEAKSRFKGAGGGVSAKSQGLVLWENNHGERCNFITRGFGPISGLKRGSIEKVIYQTTLSGSKTLVGRSILKKAMADCRLLLSYWREFFC